MSSFGTSFIIVVFVTYVFLMVKQTVDYYIDNNLRFNTIHGINTQPPHVRGYLRESCRRRVIDGMIANEYERYL